MSAKRSHIMQAPPSLGTIDKPSPPSPRVGVVLIAMVCCTHVLQVHGTVAGGYWQGDHQAGPLLQGFQAHQGLNGAAAVRGSTYTHE